LSVQPVEFGQRQVVAGVGAGPAPGQVLLDPDEQILRLQVRVGVGQPAPLLGDDVDHGLLDQNGRHDTIDLGLLVAQFGHERVWVIGIGGSLRTRDWLQWLVIEHQDLGGPPPGQRLQQPDAGSLGIAESFDHRNGPIGVSHRDRHRAVGR
jgi:hypothetical protein